jgi:cytochrome c oxidase subunit IV
MTHEISKSTYTRIFIALMVLLVLTVAAVFLPFDRWNMRAIGISLAFLIATIKAVLVVLYFMHVKFSSKLVRTFVIAVLVWLGILFSLTFSDYLTRRWLPVSRSWADWTRTSNIPPPAPTP